MIPLNLDWSWFYVKIWLAQIAELPEVCLAALVFFSVQWEMHKTPTEPGVSNTSCSILKVISIHRFCLHNNILYDLVDPVTFFTQNSCKTFADIPVSLNCDILC